MLQTIREKLTGWVALAFVVIIGLSLALTFGSDPGGMGRDYAARVNGEEIPVNEYRQIYQNQLMQQQEQFGIDLPDVFVRQLQREVLDGLVLSRVIRQYVKEAGLRVSDQRLADEIRRLPALQVGGEFSPQTYIALLASQGLSPAGFEAEQRQAMAVQQLQAAVVESSFFTPAEFRQYIRLEGEQRAVAWAGLDPRQLLGEIQISEEEVRAYFEDNPAEFVAEESVRLQYVEVNLDQIAAGLDVSDDDLREAYEADRSRFVSDEERRARHILIAIDGSTTEDAARAQAEELAARLAAGEDFAALAQEFSADTGSAGQGGDLGFAGRGVFVGAFEDALFQLEEGEVSAPVRTEFGYHLIKLDAVRGEAGLSFAEARDELRLEVQRRLAEDTYFDLAAEVEDLALENRASLDPVVQRTGLELREIENFTRAGGGPLGFSLPLVNAVFSAVVLEDGENSALIEVEDGRAVVVRVLEHRLPEPLPFAEVREQIRNELAIARAALTASNRGERMLERAAAGESLATLAEELGGSYGEPRRLNRRSQQLPPELLNAIFRAPRPPAADQPVLRGLSLSDGSYVVFRLEEVIPGQPDDLPREERDQRKLLLARATGNQDIEALAATLREQARVVIRQDLFEQQQDF